MYDETTLLNELASVVKTHANYDDNNVKVGSQRVLDWGVVTAVVIEAGPIDSPEDHEYNYMAGVTSVYSATAYVYRKFVQDAESRANLRADTKNVRETIDGHPTLNGNAQKCKITAIGTPLYVGKQNSPPSFIVRMFTVTITKIEEMVLSE